MVLIPKLETRQSQGLAMTPQIQQAIKLLQMSHLELQGYVETELENNPLLEREELDSSSGSDFSAQQLPDHTEKAREESSVEPIAGESSEAPHIKDSGWLSLSSSSSSGHFGEDPFDAVSLVRAEVSLIEALEEQLATSSLSAQERLIAHALIAHVDERGYCGIALEALAQMLGVGLAEVEHVLGVLQGFEPSGIMARDLRECLEIQLKEKGIFNPVYTILLSHLLLLARKDFSALKKVCAIDEATLKDMVAKIRLLNPKPGNAFGPLVVQPVIPDVFVKEQANGVWLVELNTSVLPRVLVNHTYYAMVSSASLEQKEKVFLSQCHANASWLVRSLDQRARTILSVSREIVRQQDAFLAHGITALRPLNLRTVAEVLGLHESTISRAISHKYIATPRGVFEMKYFFTTAIASPDGGEAVSAEMIRQRIKALIEQEGENVLSDDQIVACLKKEGLEIARRTVAKYREALGIASSVMRKRELRI